MTAPHPPGPAVLPRSACRADPGLSGRRISQQLRRPQGQVVPIVSSPSTVDLDGLPVLWLPAPTLWHHRFPRGLALAPEGRAIQDRATFPAGTQPGGIPLSSLSPRLDMSQERSPDIFLSPPPQPTKAEAGTTSPGEGGGARGWSQLEPVPSLLDGKATQEPRPPRYSFLLPEAPSAGPRIRTHALYLTPVWPLPHSRPSSDKRQSGA